MAFPDVVLILILPLLVRLAPWTDCIPAPTLFPVKSSEANVEISLEVPTLVVFEYSAKFKIMEPVDVLTAVVLASARIPTTPPVPLRKDKLDGELYTPVYPRLIVPAFSIVTTSARLIFFEPFKKASSKKLLIP